MKSATTFIRSRPWLVFVGHQALIFATALALLASVRRLTGRSIHGGRDAVGLADGAALVALSAGVILGTRWLYRWLKGPDAPPLGLAPSPRRAAELLVGLAVGVVLASLPWAVSLATGAAWVDDRVDAHVDLATAARFVSVGMLLLVLQAATEETANRAFPLRLWEHRSLAFRLLVPSLFFAAIHLADESFGAERAAVLVVAGVVQSLAYLATGNVWFATGLHAGANIAGFAVSGLWHAGAVVSIVGRLAFPNWVGTLIMLAAMLAIYAALGRCEAHGTASGSDRVGRAR